MENRDSSFIFILVRGGVGVLSVSSEHITHSAHKCSLYWQYLQFWVSVVLSGWKGKEYSCSQKQSCYVNGSGEI